MSSEQQPIDLQGYSSASEEMQEEPQGEEARVQAGVERDNYMSGRKQRVTKAINAVLGLMRLMSSEEWNAYEFEEKAAALRRIIPRYEVLCNNWDEFAADCLCDSTKNFEQRVAELRQHADQAGRVEASEYYPILVAELERLESGHSNPEPQSDTSSPVLPVQSPTQSRVERSTPVSQGENLPRPQGESHLPVSQGENLPRPQGESHLPVSQGESHLPFSQGESHLSHPVTCVQSVQPVQSLPPSPQVVQNPSKVELKSPFPDPATVPRYNLRQSTAMNQGYRQNPPVVQGSQQSSPGLQGIRPSRPSQGHFPLSHSRVHQSQPVQPSYPPSTQDQYSKEIIQLLVSMQEKQDHQQQIIQQLSNELKETKASMASAVSPVVQGQVNILRGDEELSRSKRQSSSYLPPARTDKESGIMKSGKKVVFSEDPAVSSEESIPTKSRETSRSRILRKTCSKDKASDSSSEESEESAPASRRDSSHQSRTRFLKVNPIPFSGIDGQYLNAIRTFKIVAKDYESDAHRLIALQATVTGPAKELIRGYKPGVSGEYKKALKALKEKYGSKLKRGGDLWKELENLPPKGTGDTEETEVRLRKIASIMNESMILGVDVNSPSYIDKVMNKLHLDVSQELRMIKEFKDMSELLEAAEQVTDALARTKEHKKTVEAELGVEVDVHTTTFQDNCIKNYCQQGGGNKDNTSHRFEPRERNVCKIDGEDHHTSQCPKNCEEKLECAETRNLCRLCLEPASHMWSKGKCRGAWGGRMFCDKCDSPDHHPFLCHKWVPAKSH